MHTACDKRVDDRFVLDFPYGIAIANPFLIADDSDQILGHRLGYVCRIPLAVSNAMQCFRCYPLLMPKGHQTLKNWKWLFKPCFTPWTNYADAKTFFNVFPLHTYMEILLLIAVVAEARMSLNIFTS
jgi:hypothetical protein